jgi:hypothetical protein
MKSFTPSSHPQIFSIFFTISTLRKFPIYLPGKAYLETKIPRLDCLLSERTATFVRLLFQASMPPMFTSTFLLLLRAICVVTSSSRSCKLASQPCLWSSHWLSLTIKFSTPLCFASLVCTHNGWMEFCLLVQFFTNLTGGCVCGCGEEVVYLHSLTCLQCPFPFSLCCCEAGYHTFSTCVAQPMPYHGRCWIFSVLALAF